MNDHLGWDVAVRPNQNPLSNNSTHAIPRGCRLSPCMVSTFGNSMIEMGMIIAGGCALALLSSLLLRWKFRNYFRRKCQGSVWKDRFPEAKKEDIRTFLTIFCDAFLLPKKHRLRFGPDDRPMAIYERIYRGGFMADAMEFENFAIDLKRRFNVEFPDGIAPSMTLGDIFGTASRQPNKSRHGTA